MKVLEVKYDNIYIFSTNRICYSITKIVIIKLNAFMIKVL
jgi:hypothetical protein